METRNSRRAVQVDQSVSLLSLSRDLIFWQGEAQRQRELNERHGALHALSLHVLGGATADWADKMAKAVVELVPRLGADCWYAGIFALAGPPEMIVSSGRRSAPAGSGPNCLEPDLMAALTARLRDGEAAAAGRSEGVAGALWIPIDIAGISGFSGCHSTSRQIVASEAVRALLHGLGEIALAAHRRV